mgnify:CR=1 FL=1
MTQSFIVCTHIQIDAAFFINKLLLFQVLKDLLRAKFAADSLSQLTIYSLLDRG